MNERRRIGPSVGMVLLLGAFALSPVPTPAAEPCVKAAALASASADRRATEEIERRIASDETVAPLARTVQVTTTEGVVTLRGTVADDEDRLVLASLAESAPGVRRVEDRLELRR